MNYFSFVNDRILKKNFDIALDYIFELITLSKSEICKSKPVLVSNLRKSIIIHTASVIEALLLWKLKQKIKTQQVELSNEWKYFNIKILHTINKSQQIIAGRRELEKKRLDRLDFLRIIDLCLKYKIINKSLSNKLHKTRELRNKLHIGGLKEIEKNYTNKILKSVFIAMLETEDVVSK